MGYHYAEYSCIGRGQHNGENVTLWLIGTKWHESESLNEGVAYTREDEHNKILRWQSNDAVVPADIMEVATGLFEENWPFRAEMNEARDAQMAATIAAYKQGRANMTSDQRAEEAFERLAAFGPGKEVVNVITGERFNT